MKKIVFLDATGTLFYPKRTKNNSDPGFIQNKFKKDIDKLCNKLVLTPTTAYTLRVLKKKGIKRVIISAANRPHNIKKLQQILKHFKIRDLIDEVHVVDITSTGMSKVNAIKKILKRLKIPKKYALMVGDSYYLDYFRVKSSGVDAYLIYSKFMETKPWGDLVKKTRPRIRKLKEILAFT
jgi:hydroxymethylpyrimidine pyrophosphatase-like HAD family hydrolase